MCSWWRGWGVLGFCKSTKQFDISFVMGRHIWPFAFLFLSLTPYHAVWVRKNGSEKKTRKFATVRRDDGLSVFEWKGVLPSELGRDDEAKLIWNGLLTDVYGFEVALKWNFISDCVWNVRRKWNYTFLQHICIWNIPLTVSSTDRYFIYFHHILNMHSTTWYLLVINIL